MGHEIGYHYESLSRVAAENKNLNHGQLLELAKEDFRGNLKKLRELVPIKTICMHGSPLSKLDNRDLWSVYDYRDFGIECEPYLDIDFSEVFYLTDTGRRWDGDHVSIRDWVSRGNQEWPVYRKTRDIIDAIQAGNFPLKSMVTTHPQRWTDDRGEWIWEAVSQRLKNVGKSLLISTRKKDKRMVPSISNLDENNRR